jgi:hypothetical protein
VQDVLGFGVTQPKRPTVQDHFGCAAVIELRRPMLFLLSAGCHFTE